MDFFLDDSHFHADACRLFLVPLFFMPFLTRLESSSILYSFSRPIKSVFLPSFSYYQHNLTETSGNRQNNSITYPPSMPKVNITTWRASRASPSILSTRTSKVPAILPPLLLRFTPSPVRLCSENLMIQKKRSTFQCSPIPCSPASSSNTLNPPTNTTHQERINASLPL